jgi:amino acid adenylation domain-containing protein
MAEHFQTLLAGAIANAQQRLSDLPLLTSAERRQLLVDWNATTLYYPDTLCIHQLFESQVARTPHESAIIAGRERLTYTELNARADVLAQTLRERGVGPEVCVGVCLTRSPDLLVALLAVLKAGGAYVPLDPKYPTARRQWTLIDAQAPVVLAQTHTLAAQDAPEAEVLYLDRMALQPVPPGAMTTSAQPDNLAYLIYTSGSTGKPKGVAISHRSAVSFLSWAQWVFTPEQRAGVLASTSVCFDLSIFELFGPLSWGGTVILAEHALQLPSLPAADQVTLINTVPSALQELLRLGQLPTSIQVINLAGEPLPLALTQQIYSRYPHLRVMNLYGPSETTTYSTSAYVAPESTLSPSIGRPVGNTEVYIFDQRMQPVPIGVVGELYIGGVGVARGYLNRPELSAEAFIPHPFSRTPGARLYRTGDLARYRSDGELEFLGRRDHQVKVRGFRIELGEIEAALTQHSSVRECVVIARAEQSDTRLVAYLTTQPGETLSIQSLRAFLEGKLPAYMIPAMFVVLDMLPLTPNGKIDRRALPAPDQQPAYWEKERVAPRTPLEQQIAAVWSRILRVERVGIHETFFELGGNSLLIVQVYDQLRDVVACNFSLVELFQYPTISALAQYLAPEPDMSPSPTAPMSRTRTRGETARRRREFSRTTSPIQEHKGDHHYE